MTEDREAFLRAIFDAPDDDLPRLVYADWLDEHGDATLAELIRVECGWAGLDPFDLAGRAELSGRATAILAAAGVTNEYRPRGFRYCPVIELNAEALNDAIELRRVAAVEFPEWFGATRLKVTGGRVTGAVQAETLLTAPAFAKVTAFDLRGVVTERPIEEDGVTLYDVDTRPVVTLLGVEVLVGQRASRRITELLLTNNELDNDAARLLVRSPYLVNLKRLDVLDGNRLRGRTWQDLLSRFGPDVLGGDVPF